jgi:hypothetical protein
MKNRHLAIVAVLAGIWAGVLGYLFPTDSTSDQLSRVALAAALLWAIGATSYRVSANRLLHGDLFDMRGERQAGLFSLTQLWSEYSRYRSGLRDGLQLVLVFVLVRQAPGVWVSFSGALAVVFFVFWRAIKRVPPAVLVVGRSSEPFSAEIHALRGALHPLRIMALLDVVEQDSPFYWDRFDNFRTTREWRQVFHILLDSAPIIVLDGRVNTTNLLYEVEAVSQTAGKHVLVIADDGGVAWQQSLASNARSFYVEKAVHVQPSAVASEVGRLAQLVVKSIENEAGLSHYAA